MPAYSKKPRDEGNIAKAKGGDIRVHFKNSRELARTLQGMSCKKANQYLKDVLDHQRCVPFRRFATRVGRTAQAKEWGGNVGRWPKKSVDCVQSMLRNAEANAALKGLEGDLFISHIQVNKARHGRRRTYRAHGRIGAYMSTPSHMEVILTKSVSKVLTPK